MIEITIPECELFNELTEEFIYAPEQKLQLEHSLASLYDWESKWNKPFISKNKKTSEESIDYVRCMTLTPNVDPSVYYRLSDDNIQEINGYLERSMTATTFHNYGKPQKPSREIITAEIIYYWMITLGIPLEPCQYWHLDRLFTLIKVCSLKNSPSKKMSKKDLYAHNAAINAANKKLFNSKG